MSTTMFAALLALTPGQGVPYSPPAVHYPPPPFIEPGTEANFVTPLPGGGYVPNLYPIVPQPVVIAHPDWYPYPGPAYWYANNVSPYHPVYHGVVNVGPAVPGAQGKTLYDRLGGEPALRAVVDDLVARLAADPKVNVTRKGTPKEWKPTPENVEHLKKGFVDLLGMVTGGPQKYTGKSMKELHAGMQITQAEFDAAAADLKATLNKLKVPAREQDELMKIIGSTAPDIVEKKERR